MAASVEELERRLAALRAEVDLLRLAVFGGCPQCIADGDLYAAGFAPDRKVLEDGSVLIRCAFKGHQLAALPAPQIATLPEPPR